MVGCMDRPRDGQVRGHGRPEGVDMDKDTRLLVKVRKLIEPALSGDDLAARVETLNALRDLLHELSPFGAEPVDTVTWVPADTVQANDYNPNSVAPPEMELLRLSIAADGFTQPIVTMDEED